MEHVTEDSYEIAIQMLNQETNMVWNRYNVFLVANSIIIAATGMLVTTGNKGETSFLKGIVYVYPWLVISGIILCLCWGILTLYGFLVCSGYSTIACELEKNREIRILNCKGRPTSGKSSPIVAIFTIFVFLSMYSLLWAVPNWEYLIPVLRSISFLLPPALALVVLLGIIGLSFYLTIKKSRFQNDMKGYFKKNADIQ